ncbi:MAG: bifunctional demethylmenaquinone methyltransferase/2-methoxy-6-polyprenyl-1,4-benzoquinol methylase UbiE [Synechococcales bacterium]|nr:bifunctional demethylmenaquinone methyltransferase/2-methoxy-6-polyprenyl-1,4-benzoquinol methylase UbiE [Synechococcales bacterium]
MTAPGSVSESRPPASTVQSLFDRIAPVYDELNQTLSLGQHKIWKLMAVKWCEPKPGDRALDLCCGSGDVAELLGDRVGRTGQVTGVDFSAAQLETAQARTADKTWFQWLQADVLQLPFADNHFDCAAMSYGLRNVSDIPKALGEMQRVLKPGAKIAILDMHRPENPWVRQFQQWYLDAIVVPAAQRLGFTEEYAYIAPSLDRFPTGQAQVKLGLEAGFTKAVHYPIAGGTMGVLVLTK